MTKLRSKKMSKSTFAVIIMAIVMVAMLAFGGTYAYFTASASEKSGTLTTGRVVLGDNQMATLTTSKVVHGESLFTDGSFAVNNKSDVKTWVFVKFDTNFQKDGVAVDSNEVELVTDEMLAEAQKTAATYDYTITADGKEQYRIDYTVSSGWIKLANAPGVYFKEVEPATKDGEETVAIDDITVCTDMKFYGASKSTTTSEYDETTGTYKPAVTTEGYLMGCTITITISSSSIQYAGFTYDEGADADATAQNQMNAATLAAKELGYIQ